MSFGLKSAYNPIFIRSKTHEPQSSDLEADVSETNEVPTESSLDPIAKAAASSTADDTMGNVLPLLDTTPVRKRELLKEMVSFTLLWLTHPIRELFCKRR